MKKTKGELYGDLAYCYILNTQVKHRCEEALPGFIWALIICLIAIPVNIFIALRSYSESDNFLMIFNIIIAAFCLFFSGVLIFFIIDNRRELKKCINIDKKLKEMELQVKEMED